MNDVASSMISQSTNVFLHAIHTSVLVKSVYDMVVAIKLLIPSPLTPCSYNCTLPYPPGAGLYATAVAYFLLSLALTIVLIARSLLWCRGERRQGITLICSPVVSLKPLSL